MRATFINFVVLLLKNMSEKKVIIAECCSFQMMTAIWLCPRSHANYLNDFCDLESHYQQHMNIYPVVRNILCFIHLLLHHLSADTCIYFWVSITKKCLLTMSMSKSSTITVIKESEDHKDGGHTGEWFFLKYWNRTNRSSSPGEHLYIHAIQNVEIVPFYNILNPWITQGITLVSVYTPTELRSTVHYYFHFKS